MKPSTPARGVTARDLFAKSNRRIISDIVQEHVRLIDGAITNAHAAGFNRIEYELPVNFSINNMSKADAQTLIYSEILLIYKTPEPEGKGFEDIRIEPGVKSSKIFITWLNGMDVDERDDRQRVIRSCLVNAPAKNRS
jgi:hypothetical protein